LKACFGISPIYIFIYIFLIFLLRYFILIYNRKQNFIFFLLCVIHIYMCISEIFILNISVPQFFAVRLNEFYLAARSYASICKRISQLRTLENCDKPPMSKQRLIKCGSSRTMNEVFDQAIVTSNEIIKYLFPSFQIIRFVTTCHFCRRITYLVAIYLFVSLDIYWLLKCSV